MRKIIELAKHLIQLKFNIMKFIFVIFLHFISQNLGRKYDNIYFFFSAKIIPNTLRITFEIYTRNVHSSIIDNKTIVNFSKKKKQQ